MGFTGAFYLRDLDKRLIPHALVSIGGIQRVSIICFQAEHLTVGHIGVVRNGDGFIALGALLIHPVPQIFRIGGVECREGTVWRVSLEEDIAVKVSAAKGAVLAICRDGGEFIGREGGELPRHIMAVCRVDIL